MAENRKTLTETEAKNILAEYGIDVARGLEVATADESVKAAEEIGFPVVLKVSHPDVTHKSDAGGVMMDLYSPDEVRRAAGHLLTLHAQAKIRVEKQAEPGGADLILGFKRDPVFGPAVMVGMGGIFAEILDDTSLHVGKLRKDEAPDMIRRLKGYALLEGARGQAPLDRIALTDALIALSSIADDHPEIVEMDINPWRLYEKGGMALDALAVTDIRAAETRKAYKNPENAHALRDIHSFFSPRSVAVVGASTTTVKGGNNIISNLKTFGYKGDIYPVNPSGGLIEGLPCYPTVADCPAPPDVVILAVPYHQVRKVMEDVAQAGSRNIIAVAGGFSDAGPEGRRLEEALLDFCRQHRIRLMGPNSIGTLDSNSGFCTAIVKISPVKPSGVSIFGQTGTLSTGFVLEELSIRERGFSKVACLGNKADIDESDLLEYLAADPDTRCIGIYMESVRDGGRFIRAARSAAGAKPVVILKAGRTEAGARTAASHTGALAGTDAVYDAVFRQTGLQRVDTFAEFYDTLRGFDLCPLPAGKRIGIVSMTGVGCVLAADACDTFGMELAPISGETQAGLKALVPEWAPVSNPADIWSTIEQRGPFDAFQKMCDIMIRDTRVDILLVITVLVDEGTFDAPRALEPLKTSHPGKPILAAYVGGHQRNIRTFQTGLESIGIPVYSCPEAAVKTASCLYQRTKRGRP